MPLSSSKDLYVFPLWSQQPKTPQGLISVFEREKQPFPLEGGEPWKAGFLSVS